MYYVVIEYDGHLRTWEKLRKRYWQQKKKKQINGIVKSVWLWKRFRQQYFKAKCKFADFIVMAPYFMTYLAAIINKAYQTSSAIYIIKTDWCEKSNWPGIERAVKIEKYRRRNNSHTRSNDTHYTFCILRIPRPATGFVSCARINVIFNCCKIQFWI